MIFFLADIHLGVKLPQEDFMNSLDQMFTIIRNSKEPCDLIIVCGDLFDHNLNIDESIFAVQFLVKLVLNDCGKGDMKHIPVHFIEGTFSHDRKQMKIFMPLLENLPCSVFYTDTWCKVELPNGIKALYLPQEYGNVDYSDAFNEHYDLIVGHGPISSQNKQVVTSHGTEIMHSVEMLGEHSDLCVFGHYHEYTDFGNGVYYAGSMLRFRYHEDTPKVFFMCDKDFKVTTVKNPFAKEFKTIEIHNPEELRDELSKQIDSPHRFVISTTNDQELEAYHAIMNTTKQNQFVKFKIERTEEVVEEDKLDVIQHSNVVEPIEGLLQFINEKYNVDVTKEVREYEDKIKQETTKK